MKDGQREERKKDEQREKVDAPQLSSSCASLGPRHFRCRLHVPGHTQWQPVSPIPIPLQHTLYYCSHRQDSSAPSSWLYLGYVVISTNVSSVTVDVAVALGWDCLVVVSPLSLVCGSVLLSSAVTVRPVSLMTWCSNGISISSLRRAI